MTIPAATRMGAVHLTVADMERSLEFYRESIGLELLAQTPEGATLGVGEKRHGRSQRRGRFRHHL